MQALRGGISCDVNYEKHGMWLKRRGVVWLIPCPGGKHRKEHNEIMTEDDACVVRGAAYSEGDRVDENGGRIITRCWEIVRPSPV